MCAIQVPAELNGQAEVGAAAMLAKTVADIAVLLDAQGAVLDVALGNEGLAQEVGADWVGKPWADTVSADTRPRLESLLRDLHERKSSDWRQVVHRGRQGRDVPVQYRAIQVGDRGHILAFGRELQVVASLQQQLVDAQQALERDYWRYRQMETRYRLLFQSVSEAVLVVDSALRRVVEANPAAIALLSNAGSNLVGRPFPEGFEPTGMRALESLLGSVLSSGRAESVRARRQGAEADLTVSVSLLRQDDAVLFVVRLRPQPAETRGPALPEQEARLLKAVGAAPDAILITDPEGRILAANRAFLDQVELATEHLLRGQSLDRWLGRATIDLNVLLSTLRQHGSLRLFRTTLRGEYGTTVEAEICAAAVPNGDRPCFGFFIRDVGRRLIGERAAEAGLPVWVGELTDRVGSAPLKDLVRESTDLIERLCIEAALKLTGGNRASAAELLGLSRQSLYVKLARYGIGGEAPEQE
ncbi:MAG: transcriptional regulator PpsR [Bdellovibrio bacteriovorus]